MSFCVLPWQKVEGNIMQFIDLAAQQARIKDKIDAGIQGVLAHGKYILGSR